MVTIRPPLCLFLLLSIAPTTMISARRRPPPPVDHFLRDDLMSAAQHNLTVLLHNYVRGHVQPTATNMLKLTFDAALQANAQKYSEQCHYDHRVAPIMIGGVEVGENLYVRSTSERNLTAVLERAINTWFDEHADYDYVTMTCTPGAVCGHYTQVVWGETARVGCGISTCQNIRSGTPGRTYRKGQLMVCNYSPVGNFKGERPYVTGARSCSAPRCHGGEDCVCDRGYDRLYEYAHLEGVREYIGGISKGLRVRNGSAAEDPSTTQSTSNAATKVTAGSSTVTPKTTTAKPTPKVKIDAPQTVTTQNRRQKPSATQATPNTTLKERITSPTVTPKTTSSQASTTAQAAPNTTLKERITSPTVTPKTASSQASTTAQAVLKFRDQSFPKVNVELPLNQTTNRTVDYTAPNPTSGAVRNCSFCLYGLYLTMIFTLYPF